MVQKTIQRIWTMANDTFSDKITAYLSGELSPQEEQRFENIIARDPALAAEVELRRLENKALDELLRQDIEQKIPGWLDSVDELPAPPAAPPAVGKTHVSTDALRWAFGLVALLSLAGMFWLWKKGVNERNRTRELERQLQKEQMKYDDAQIQLQLLRDDLKALHQAAPENPPTKTTKQVEQKTGKTNTDLPNSTPAQVFTDLPALVDTSAVEGLYATLEADWKGSSQTKSNQDINTVALKHFEAAQKEFFNKDRNNQFITVNLLQIPPEETVYPKAQAMLAEIYFKEKNYRQALTSFEIYAVHDQDVKTQWRLLNFRLAAYPYKEDQFWDLLHKFCEKSSVFNTKAIELRDKLNAIGIIVPSLKSGTRKIPK